MLYKLAPYGREDMAAWFGGFDILDAMEDAFRMWPNVSAIVLIETK